MRRAAVPLFKSVVPAITQIPASLSDVAFANGTVQHSSWEDTSDRQIISTSDKYDSYTTTTTTTSTSTSPLWESRDLDLSVSYPDSKEISSRLESVYESLEIGYAPHPTSAALVQVVKDTTNLLNVDNILKFDSFKLLTTTLAKPQLQSSRDVETPSTHTTMGTQTEDLDFLEDFDTRLQSITSQLINDPLATSTSSNLTHTSTVVSGTSTTVANTTTITSNPTPTVSASTNYAQEELDFTEGSAGVPGSITDRSLAIKVIIPLALLAVAAVVALPMESALNLLKSGFKFMSRVLGGGQPAF